MPLTLDEVKSLIAALGVKIPEDILAHKAKAEEFKARRERVAAEAGGKPVGWRLKATFDDTLKRAAESAGQKQFDAALNLLDEAGQLLLQSDAPPPAAVPSGVDGLSIMKLGKARIEWNGIHSKAVQDIQLLRTALNAEFADDVEQQPQVTAALTKLDSLIAELNADLGAKLDDVLNAKADAQRNEAIKSAKATMQRFVTLVETDEVMAALDGNEITPDAQITAPLQAKLRDIAAALG